MAAAEVLAPRPGEKVLDISAAPGGKATHLAALMKNQGLLVANEIHQKRVWDLAGNLERCGVTNAIVTNETPQRLADHFGPYFDRVLLDAPCSGEGMFRKGDVARKEWKPEMVHSCAIRQSSILEHAAYLVKPGGVLAYTTCTFSAEENEGVIVGFLDHHREFDLAMVQLAPGYQPARPDWCGYPHTHPLDRAIRIWPHLSQGEGHFIACLVKRDDSQKDNQKYRIHSEKYPKREARGKDRDVSLALLDDFCHGSLAISFDHACLDNDGSYIYQLPDNPPDLAGLRVIRRGLWLGTINKGRIIPSHSLALSMNSQQAKSVLHLSPDDDRLPAYLRGDTLSSPGEDGWVLVTVDGFPLGWGKRVHNVIKNYYPHGLRQSS